MKIHEACSVYCTGNEHVVLVLAQPDVSMAGLAAYTASFGGVLRHAAPAEVDPAAFEPQWNFLVETQQYAPLTTCPSGIIVWRLHVDCSEVHVWPPSPLTATVSIRPLVPWRRLWRWMCRTR